MLIIKGDRPDLIEVVGGLVARKREERNRK